MSTSSSRSPVAGSTASGRRPRWKQYIFPWTWYEGRPSDSSFVVSGIAIASSSRSAIVATPELCQVRPGYNGRPQGVYPSGQRGRAVTPLAEPTEVRLLPPPLARFPGNVATTGRSGTNLLRHLTRVYPH